MELRYADSKAERAGGSQSKTFARHERLLS
jgi:hypothetical protein